MKLVPILLALLALFPGTASAASVLQCAPYARERSGIPLYGNAATWWGQAQGVYTRGDAPKTGAILVFKATSATPYGHVAVVDRIVDDRRVMLDHANWSRPGMIERGVLAEDVSAAGDWSEVRVWYAPTKSLGLRASAAFGFIYADAKTAPTKPELARSATKTNQPG